MRIRRLRADEVDLLRALRLRALADAPDAFGERFADISAKPDPYWVDLLRSLTDPNRNVMFVAHDDRGSPAGMAFGIRDRSHADIGHVGGMWVEPGARRSGAAAQLTAAVVEWSRGERFRRVVLWVTETNAPAIALYRRCGFAPTGERNPLPSNPSLSIIEMAREID